MVTACYIPGACYVTDIRRLKQIATENFDEIDNRGNSENSTVSAIDVI